MRSLQKFVVQASEEAFWHGGLRQKSPTGIVLHGDGSHSFEQTIRYLNHEAPQETPAKFASYNYGIPKRESIVRWLDPTYIAYHAGRSSWPVLRGDHLTRKSLNASTIGICFNNRNKPSDEITDWQREAGLWLCVTMVRRFKTIPVDRIRAHWEVSPGRKVDPLKELFNMDEFRNAVSVSL